MAPASNEEQFKFLISCIRYSNNGKVDFGQVAKECKIVTKGAAAKRYERMMRAHGIAPNAASIKPAPGTSTSSTGSTSAPRATKKKRKYEENDENADDEDDFGGMGMKNVKREKEALIKGEKGVKLEHEGMMGMGSGLSEVNRELVNYYSGGSSHAGSVGPGTGYKSGGEAASGFEYEDLDAYAFGSGGATMGNSGMSSGGMNNNALSSGVGMNSTGLGSGGMNNNGMGNGGQGSATGLGYATPRAAVEGYGGNHSYGLGSMMGPGSPDEGMLGKEHKMMGLGQGMGGLGGMGDTGGAGGIGSMSMNYQSTGQSFNTQGGSDSPYLVE